MLAGVRGKCCTNQKRHLCTLSPPWPVPSRTWVKIADGSASGIRSASPCATFLIDFFILCMIVRAVAKCLTDDVENAHTFLHESSGAAQTRPCTEGEGVGID